MENQEKAIVRNLKLLLMHLAVKCEKPEEQLQQLLREVIGELHDDMRGRIEEAEFAAGVTEQAGRRLRLVPREITSDMTGACANS